MSFRTVQGRDVEYPFEVIQKIHGSVSLLSDDGRAWALEYQRVFDQLSNLDRECTTLRGEITRLKHENEFMLRLVNEKAQD
jgi:hypothetical protein